MGLKGKKGFDYRKMGWTVWRESERNRVGLELNVEYMVVGWSLNLRL